MDMFHNVFHFACSKSNDVFGETKHTQQCEYHKTHCHFVFLNKRPCKVFHHNTLVRFANDDSL